MPVWLAEDPTILYMILATAAIGLGAGFRQSRKKPLAFAAGLVLLLIPLVWLIDSLVVTDREQLRKDFAGLTKSANAVDLERIFEHIGKDFRYGNMNKATFRQACDKDVRQYGVREVVLWDFEAAEVDPDKGTAKVEFRAKAKGNWGGGYDHYYIRSVFAREPDGHWRMRTFTAFHPVNTNDVVSVPGL